MIAAKFRSVINLETAIAPSLLTGNTSVSITFPRTFLPDIALATIPEILVSCLPKGSKPVTSTDGPITMVQNSTLMSICVATLTSIHLYDTLMQSEDSDIVVVVPTDEEGPDSLALSKTIWHEITAGVGIWGTFRPVFAVVLSLVPFLFLGQHFNRKHRRATDWFLLQIPLAFTLVLWILLYVWSIIDAWKDASIIVSHSQGQI